MKCPECGKRQRFTEKEKAIIMERGEYKFWCNTCGTEMNAYKYDVNQDEKRKHNREVGICSNCGCRPATDGFFTCEHCRKYQQNRKKPEPVTYYAIIQAEKKKVKPKYSIDDLSSIARQKGISYGELVAIIEGRKRETKDLG